MRCPKYSDKNLIEALRLLAGKRRAAYWSDDNLLLCGGKSMWGEKRSRPEMG